MEKQCGEYEALQTQRAKEREIRAIKREIAGYQGVMLETDDENLLNEARNKFDTASYKLKQKEKELQDFVEQTGLKRDTARERVEGFNKSISQKAVKANQNKISTNIEKSDNIIEYKTLDLNSVELNQMQIESDIIYNNMSIDERKAIDYYTQGVYADINRYLRGEKTPFDELIDTWIPNIDNIMGNSELKDNIILYRGAKKELYEDWNVGDIKVEDYYYSTSYDLYVAKGFSEHYGNADFIIEIRASKGTKGLYIGTNSNSGFNEGEFLINRNTSYKVISKKDNKLILEVING